MSVQEQFWSLKLSHGLKYWIYAYLVCWYRVAILYVVLKLVCNHEQIFRSWRFQGRKKIWQVGVTSRNTACCWDCIVKTRAPSIVKTRACLVAPSEHGQNVLRIWHHNFPQATICSIDFTCPVMASLLSVLALHNLRIYDQCVFSSFGIDGGNWRYRTNLAKQNHSFLIWMVPTSRRDRSGVAQLSSHQMKITRWPLHFSLQFSRLVCDLHVAI